MSGSQTSDRDWFVRIGKDTLIFRMGASSVERDTLDGSETSDDCKLEHMKNAKHV